MLLCSSFVMAGYQNTTQMSKDCITPIERKKRKDKLSPLVINRFLQNVKAFFSAPLRAALTVEAAMVLPLFLFCMIAALQYCSAMETAVKFGTSLKETGENLAYAAYATKYAGEIEGAQEIALGALSAAYAQNKVMAGAGDTSMVKNANMLLSSFLQEDDMIDLVLTYQIRSPFSVVKLPGNFFFQRASVRAWTGRITAGDGEGEEGENSGQGEMVYVTATGSVYHEDPDCTHLKLSIRTVDRDALGSLRNYGGGKYHACEKCGGGSGDSVYITNEGNRYHSTLTCSGLKRTVTQVNKEECGLRPCSKCAKHESQ